MTSRCCHCLQLFPKASPLRGGQSITIIGRYFYDEQFRGRVVEYGAMSFQRCIFGDLAAVEAKYLTVSPGRTCSGQGCDVDKRCQDDQNRCLVCVVPPVAVAQSVYLTISVNSVDFFNGSSPVEFIYFDEPSVVSVGPMAGPSRGNTVLDIYGSNFKYCPSSNTLPAASRIQSTLVLKARGICLFASSAAVVTL